MSVGFSWTNLHGTYTTVSMNVLFLMDCQAQRDFNADVIAFNAGGMA